MTTYFPQRIKTASATFKYSSTAFFQLIFQGNVIKLHLQAPEIGAQFVGSVNYGKAPKGIIFYDAQIDLFAGDANYHVSYYREPGVDFNSHFLTFKVDFFKTQVLQPFATAIVRVEEKELPEPVSSLKLIPPSNQRGSGAWSNFQVGTAQTNIQGIDILGFFIVVLRPNVITKLGFFFATGTPFDKPGILIFFDRRNLVNNPKTVADYGPDRVVIRLADSQDVVALFLPAEPTPLGTGTGGTVWIEPGTKSEVTFANEEDEAKFFVKALKEADGA